MDFDLAEWMYERLPELVRARDEELADEGSVPHMKQLVTLLGSALADTYETTAGFSTIVDVDECPAVLLPELGAMLGFEFPYDLTERQQRGFIKNMVRLYSMKGTAAALEFVVTRLIGQSGFTLKLINEDHIAKTFSVELSADEGSETLDALEDKVAYLVQLYSPAGMVPVQVVIFFDADELSIDAWDDSYHSSREFINFRTNVVFHHTNDNLVTNTQSSSPLSI